MSKFIKIPGTNYVENGQGVVFGYNAYDVISRDRDGFMFYELYGDKYLIPFDAFNNFELYLTGVRLLGSPTQPIPEAILNRMREDLPKINLAYGGIWKFGFSRIGKTACVGNGFGVVVDFGYSPHSVSYEVDGVKYEIYDFDPEMAGFYSHQRELDMTNIWLAEKGPESRSQVPQSILDKMEEDLPKAYAAFGLKFKFKK